MRLLVTGGAGYIGSVVAQGLVARGDEVTVLDSLFRGHRDAVPDGAEVVQGDLLDESVAHPERYYRGNVTGTLNLLDAMRASEVRRIVFSSTAATYGEPDVI